MKAEVTSRASLKTTAKGLSGRVTGASETGWFTTELTMSTACIEWSDLEQVMLSPLFISLKLLFVLLGLD